MLYADDFVLIARTLEDAQKLMHMINISYSGSRVQVKIDKTRPILVKTHKRAQPHITYQGEVMETMKLFK